MSTAIETHYVQTYKNNVELLAQQRKSILEPYVTVQPCEGLACAVRDQYGTVDVKEKTQRHEDTKYSDTPRARRWLMPREFYTAEMYDQSDLIRMLTDPQSPLVMAHVAAMERAKDSVILGAFFAAAATGEQPTSGTTAYDTNNDIAADVEVTSTPAGLTITKLIKAKGRLIRNQVDTNQEVPTCVINAKAWEDMFGQTNFISGDYQNNKPLQSAPTAIFQGGANLVTLEHTSFPVNSTTEWYLPYFVKSGMVLGTWSGMDVTVERVPGKVSSWEVKVISRFAATRVDEKKVVRTKIKYA
jgi:hypothetical protein